MPRSIGASGALGGGPPFLGFSLGARARRREGPPSRAREATGRRVSVIDGAVAGEVVRDQPGGRRSGGSAAPLGLGRPSRRRRSWSRVVAEAPHLLLSFPQEHGDDMLRPKRRRCVANAREDHLHLGGGVEQRHAPLAQVAIGRTALLFPQIRRTTFWRGSAGPTQSETDGVEPAVLDPALPSPAPGSPGSLAAQPCRLRPLEVSVPRGAVRRPAGRYSWY